MPIVEAENRVDTSAIAGGGEIVKQRAKSTRIPLKDMSNAENRRIACNVVYKTSECSGPMKIPRVKRRVEPYAPDKSVELEASSGPVNAPTDPRPVLQTLSSVPHPSSCSTSASSTRRDEDAQLSHSVEVEDVAEYLPDMCFHMEKEELNCCPSPGYMSDQPQLNSRMRAILVSWLTDVCRSYKLRLETLFLTIGLIDRYLEKRQTGRSRLQLVGISALLVAAKFEECKPPKIQNLVNLTDKVFTVDEVVSMEMSMLRALNFKVFRPTAAHFLRQYQRSTWCGELREDLTQHLLELTLTDYQMLQYSASHVAAAALLVTAKLEQKIPAWTPQAATQTKKSELMLKTCAKQICDLLENSKCTTWRSQVQTSIQSRAIMS